MFPLDDPVLMFIILAAFAGLLVWGIAIQDLIAGRWPLPARESGPVAWNHWAVLAAMMIWIFTDAGLASLWKLNQDSPMLLRIQINCLSSLIKCAAIGLMLWGIGGLKIKQLWNSAATLRLNLMSAFWALFAALPPVWIVGLAIQPLRTDDNGHAYIRLLEENPGPMTVAWIALAVLVAAPLFEELLFRVLLQGWLQTRVSPAAAVVSVAFAFAAIHGSSWPDPLPLIPLSLILGYLYYRRRSYLANVLMHSLFNGVNLWMAISTG